MAPNMAPILSTRYLITMPYKIFKHAIRNYHFKKVIKYNNIADMKEQLWKITFYDKSVEYETLSLPDTILANLLRVLEMAKEIGSNLGRPHSAPLGN